MWVVHVLQVLCLAQLTYYVVRGMRGVGGVYEMCMCLARGGMGGEVGEWMRVLGFGFTNPVGTGGVLGVCVSGLRWCVCGVGRGLDQGLDYLCR